jgi:Lon protease-like protein
LSEPHELPLFPLGTVLLPEGPLALRVFEPLAAVLRSPQVTS